MMFSLRRPSPPRMARVVLASCPSVLPTPPTNRAMTASSNNSARLAPDNTMAVCSRRSSPTPTSCLSALPLALLGEKALSQASLINCESK
ncbi:hypothetical protein D3C80_1758600 [compost metagenome]